MRSDAVTKGMQQAPHRSLFHALGLTEEEKKEQHALRQEYVQAIRASLRGSLDNISIKEADGSITDLGERYGKKDRSGS